MIILHQKTDYIASNTDTSLLRLHAVYLSKKAKGLTVENYDARRAHLLSLSTTVRARIGQTYTHLNASRDGIEMAPKLLLAKQSLSTSFSLLREYLSAYHSLARDILQTG